MRGERMNSSKNSNWIVDLENLTCRNTENELVITFEKRGPALLGKINKIPIQLVHEWMKDTNCEDLIRKAVIEADEVFFKEYFAHKQDKKNIETQSA
jgi:hypothetical protein